MPKKPFVDFREIRSRITMERVLEHYGVLHTLKRTGTRLSGPCPIHNGTNPSQFRVDTEKNIWNCFSECKHGGNTLDFIVKKEDCSLHDAALKACEWFKIPLDEVKNGDSQDKAEETPERPARPATKPTAKPTPDDNTPNAPLKFRLDKLQHEHPYLIERGITLETAVDFGIGFFTGDKGLMLGRVGIDNLSFSASVPLPVPVNIQVSGTNLLLNWPAIAGQTYQLEYKNNLTDPAWTPVGNPVTGMGGTLALTNAQIG